MRWLNVLILLLLFAIKTNTDVIKCMVKREFGIYISKCPVNNKTLVLRLIRGMDLEIDCNGIDTQMYSFLMEVDFFYKILYTHLRNCPIPTNGFEEIMKRFKMRNMKHSTPRNLNRLKIWREFEIYGTNISDLSKDNFKNSPELETLSLYNSRLELRNEMFKYATNLSDLTIRRNNITNIPRNCFKGLVNLKTLQISNNYIGTIENNIFDDLPNLETLDLSSNDISYFDKNIFSLLRGLKVIDLRFNKLHNMSKQIFRNCENMESIYLGNNANSHFDYGMFSEYTRLNRVWLEYNEIKSLPENIFYKSVNLMEIRLDHNLIESLPTNIFQNLKNLKVLYINDNRLKDLVNGTFRSLEKLEELHLQHNNIKVISENIFGRLKNLKHLDLSHNRIKRMHTSCFTENKNLIWINMSHNMFNFNNISPSSIAPFRNFRALEELNLGFNEITHFPYNLTSISIEDLNLDENKDMHLSSMNAAEKVIHVNLEHNDISNIEVRELNILRDFGVDEDPTGPILKVDITGDPIHCDCQVLDLMKYLNQKDMPRNKHICLGYHHLNCASPSNLKDSPFDEVLIENLTCSIGKKCTKNNECDCSYRSVDRTLLVNCSYRNLSTIPEYILPNIPEKIGHGESYKMELNMEGNSLIHISMNLFSYTNITKLFLQKNKIDNITWIPSTLQVLKVSDNSFRSMDNDTLEKLSKSNITELYLGNNPWNCDCSTKKLLYFLRDTIFKVDANNIRCSSSGKLLTKLSEEDLCPLKTGLALVISLVLLMCLLVSTALTRLFYMYKEEILIWLYAHGACLWLIEEEPIDKNMIYDAFISFARQDEEFVTNKLVPMLERGTPSYKLCIHVRDWTPGEFMSTQNMNAIRNSRRTLIILSSDVLKRIWGELEFRAAYTQAMEEGRARVIIIIYGDVDLNSLDDKLRDCIETNTYIKWGDPWFWEKLRYALPRTHNRHNKSTEIIFNGKFTYNDELD